MSDEQKELDAQQIRDTGKAQFCHQPGILFIAFDFTEPLTEEHVRERECGLRETKQHHETRFGPSTSGSVYRPPHLYVIGKTKAARQLREQSRPGSFPV